MKRTFTSTILNVIEISINKYKQLIINDKVNNFELNNKKQVNCQTYYKCENYISYQIVLPV